MMRNKLYGKAFKRIFVHFNFMCGLQYFLLTIHFFLHMTFCCHFLQIIPHVCSFLSFSLRLGYIIRNFNVGAGILQLYSYKQNWESAVCCYFESTGEISCEMPVTFVVSGYFKLLKQEIPPVSSKIKTLLTVKNKYTEV